MTAGDAKGLPHIVIIRTETDLKVIEFDGPDAMEKAHGIAMQGLDACVTVAIRVRQTCPFKLEKLMS